MGEFSRESEILHWANPRHKVVDKSVLDDKFGGSMEETEAEFRMPAMLVKHNLQSISGLAQVPPNTNVRESANKDSYVVADFLGGFRAEINSSEKSERMKPMIVERGGSCNGNGCTVEEGRNSDLGCRGSNNGRQNYRSGEKGKRWSNKGSGTSLTEYQAAASSSSSKKNFGDGEENEKLSNKGSVSRLTEFQKTSMSSENRIAKVKLMCSFGGKILSRPSDGRLRYVGGETRIIVVNKSIAYAELMHKLTDIYGESLFLKYQLPDEDLDALVSLSSDEDLDNMIEEYRRLERSEGSSRPRLFLFSPQDYEIDQFDSTGDTRISRQLYVDAVNGILNPGVGKKTGSTNSVSLQRSNNKIAQEVTGKLCEAPSTQEERRESLLCVQSIANIEYSSIDMPLSLSQSQSNSSAPEALPQPLKVISQSYTALIPTGRQNDVDYGGIIPSPQSQHGLSYRPSEPRVDLPIKAQPVFFIPPSNIDLLHGHDQHIIDAKPLKVGSQGMPMLMQEEVGVAGSALDHLLDVQQPYMDSQTLVFQYPPSSACHAPWQHQPDVRQDSHRVMDYVQSANFEGGHLQNSEPPQYGMDVYPYNVRGSRDLLDYQQMSHEYADMLPANHRVKHFSTGYEEVVNPESLAQPTSQYRGASTVQEESTSWKDQQKTRDERSRSNKEIKETQENLARLQSYVVAHGMPEYLTAEPSIRLHLIEKTDGTHGSIGSIQNKIVEGNDVSKHTASMPKMGEVELKDGQISQLLESGMDNSNEAHISEIFKPFEETYSKSSDALGQIGVGEVLVNASEVSEHTRQMKEMGVPASCSTHGTENCMPLLDLISLTDDNYKISGDVQPNVLTYTSVGGGGKTKSISQVVALPVHTNDLHMPQTLSSNFSTSGRSQTSRVSESAVYIPSSSKDIPFLSANNSISFSFQSDGEGTLSTLSSTEDNLDDFFTIELENTVGSIVKFSHRPPFPPSPTLSVNNLAQVNDDVSDENDPNGGVAEEDNLLGEEETEIADLDRKDPLSDAVIAEAEAIVRGLQTIKNVDLEELRELGSGTFGTVYHGKWRGSDVAIKRIKNCCFLGKLSEQDSLKADFWNEACMLSKLHHPNIVAFYGVVPDGPGGRLGTVTEFMVNGSLKHVLQQNKRSIDHHKRILIASDAACGMEYLHRKSIVHFDLKCDNLLVNMKDPQRPICKVADFGLSKIKHQTLISGGVRGSLPWMAPELLNCGSNMVSEKVDVFSFGIVMWELLTEKEPYADLHCGAIIGGIMNNTLRPPVPKNCEPSWRSLMVRCWLANPTARPSFSEIVDEFRSMLTSLYGKGKGH